MNIYLFVSWGRQCAAGEFRERPGLFGPLGANPAGFRDPQAAVLGEKLSGTHDGRFPVLVEKEGLYPIRMVYFERGGGAHLEWFWVNPDSGQELLINDPDCPIKAYATLAPTLVVESTPALGAPFALETTANVDMGTWTITVTPSGEQRFYRILSENIVLRVKAVNKRPNALVIEMREKQTRA